jgi:hypothetical protein
VFKHYKILHAPGKPYSFTGKYEFSSVDEIISRHGSELCLHTPLLVCHVLKERRQKEISKRLTTSTGRCTGIGTIEGEGRSL